MLPASYEQNKLYISNMWSGSILLTNNISIVMFLPFESLLLACWTYRGTSPFVY